MVLPKDIIGKLAPIPTIDIILSYIPKTPRNDPITTNILVIWPKVNLELFIIIWLIKQIVPQNRKE